MIYINPRTTISGCTAGTETVNFMIFIRHKKLRRVIGFSLVVVGALLIWLAPEVVAGIVLLAAGGILEIVGITLERRESR